MFLNIANELTTPKKILSQELSPDMTFAELKDKLIKDKMITFDDPNSIQIWQSTLKLFSDELKLNESTLIDGDTIVLRIGPKMELDPSDKYLKTALDMGFSQPMLLAALANAGGKTDEAMTYLMEAAAGMDGYQSDDEDEFAESAEYIKLALDYLNKQHPSVYEAAISDPALHRALSIAVADVVEECLDFKEPLAEDKITELVIQAVEKFSTDAWKISEFTQMNAFCEDSNLQDRQPSDVTISLDDEPSIQRLIGFGFERDQAVEAYKITNKDENAAVDLLFHMRDQAKTET